MIAITAGETLGSINISTNEEGYHKVVSQTEKEFLYKNSIYFALLVHRQE
jgi:hypothetical protein